MFMLSSGSVRPHDHGRAASVRSSSSSRHMLDAQAPDAVAAGARGRVSEWEIGLPTASELMPVTQPLIPPALAAAFGIDLLPSVDARLAQDSPTSPLSARFDDYDEEEGEGETEDAATGGAGGRGGKKARMVWTPELHHRFVEAVAHLGEKDAVPKAIVRLMNVEGLTRENVASHLQKYRLYLKRANTGAAASPPPQASPPRHFSRFASQPPPDTGNLSGHCPFISYDKLKLGYD